MTPPQQPQEHCGKEDVCWFAHGGMKPETVFKNPCRIPCKRDTRQQHSAGEGDAPMYLPEEMPFDPDDIPQKKFVIVDDELQQFFDAWMFSSKDVRILHKINDDVRNRIISIGFTSGVTCTRCHKQKSSGYYLCEQCYHENDAAIKAEAQREVLDLIIKECKTAHDENRKIGRATVDDRGKEYRRGCAVGNKEILEYAESLRRGEP